MRTSALLVMIFAASVFAEAQSCRPAELNYFVRDANGKFLTESQLRSVAKPMRTPVPDVTTIGLASDRKLVGYSGRAAASTRPALSLADAKTCHLKVDEWTLSYRGKTMRLIFDLDFERRSYTFDSLPFRKGTYRLDKTGLADSANDEIIPAARWKRSRH